MSFENLRDDGLDYRACGYGMTRRVFRGPERDVARQAVVALGGTQTFGKFIADPWPDRLERHLGRPVVNLGCVNSGPDLYLAAPPLLDIANRAEAVVIDLFGAANLNNPFYTVHGIRNDRFLAPCAALIRLYPEVDFTRFTFTRHLLGHLAHVDGERFEMLASGLQAAWVTRMTTLLEHLAPPVIGLWLADTPPPAATDGPFGQDPVLVSERMVAELTPALHDFVAVTPGAPARAATVPGRIYSQIDMQAALTVFPPQAHERVAQDLAASLDSLAGPLQ